MRIKGYALLLRSQAEPTHFPDGRVGLNFSNETAEALGLPNNRDIIMCFRTDDPAWVEIVCLADVPPQCQDVDHIMRNHMDDVEDLLSEFKARRTS